MTEFKRAGWIHPISFWLVLQRAFRMKYIKSTWKATALIFKAELFCFSHKCRRRFFWWVHTNAHSCEALFCLAVTLHSTHAPCLALMGNSSRRFDYCSDVKQSQGRPPCCNNYDVAHRLVLTMHWKMKKGSLLIPTAVGQQLVSCCASSKGGLNGHGAIAKICLSQVALWSLSGMFHVSMTHGFWICFWGVFYCTISVTSSIWAGTCFDRRC